MMQLKKMNYYEQSGRYIKQIGNYVIELFPSKEKDYFLRRVILRDRVIDVKKLKIEDIEKNLHLIDFEKLIQETLKKGESRLAIRYYYLWLLKKMTEKNVIVWDLEKTNSDSEIQFKSYEEVYGNNFEEPRIRVPDISKINRAIGWVPTKGLDEIITELVRHQNV
jgi:hypothetical protein